MASSSAAARIIGAQGLLAATAGWFLNRMLSPADKDGSAQARHGDQITAGLVLTAAADIVKAARSYGFVCTTFGRGPPECRIMDTHFLPGRSLEVALVSRSFTRKAESLRTDPQCTIAV